MCVCTEWTSGDEENLAMSSVALAGATVRAHEPLSVHVLPSPGARGCKRATIQLQSVAMAKDNCSVAQLAESERQTPNTERKHTSERTFASAVSHRHALAARANDSTHGDNSRDKAQKERKISSKNHPTAII